MIRRACYVLGFTLLLVTTFAIPARAAVCPELDPSFTDKVRDQVAATMDGHQVISSSGQPNSGDLNGTGTVLLTFQSQDTKIATVAYQVSTTDVAIPFEGAHIHKALAGDNGLSVKDLFGFTNAPDRSGTVTMSKCLAHDIFNHPADYYIDIHNGEFPDQGAIRGQLTSAN